MEFRVNGKAVQLDDEQKNYLRLTASKNDEESIEYRQLLAQVLEGVWRSGVLEPDLLDNIFDRITLEPGTDAKFPLDLYAPGEEEWHKAFVVPREGAIPDRAVDGDEIRVPTYKIGNSISWAIDYARDARWDIIARAISVYTNGFTRKLNDDGWHVIMKSASVNSVIQDTAASSGVFTKRLLTNMQTAIKRLQSGRNSVLTNVYLSPEALADIRNFDNTAVDDITLRNLLTGADIPSLFGTQLNEMQELGYGQEYQNYLVNTLSVSLPAGDEEFVIGLDLKNRDSFVMPVREDMKMYDDPTLHRKARAGVYGWMEVGFAALDTRRAIIGSL